MSRSKPELQLYRPGSGPLRKSVENENKFDIVDNKSSYNKSNLHIDNTNNRNTFSNNINQTNLSQSCREEFGSTNSLNTRQKFKKPEKSIYVPKVPTEKEKPTEKNMQTGTGNRSDYERNQYDYRRNNNMNRDRRNDGRNNNDNRDGGNFNRNKNRGNRNNYAADYDRRNDDENWRSNSSNPRYNERRDFRQASEPRIVDQNSDKHHRVRDTRSVEPLGPTRNWKQDKFHHKPPSGRRNSTISLGSDTPKLSKPPPNFDSLPPRFRNKYLKNNGLDTNSEDSWDGTSVTFQGTSAANYHQQHFPVDNHIVNSHRPAPPIWSQTIPNVRGRGRGRLHQENLDIDRLCQQFNSPGGDDKLGMPNFIPKPVTLHFTRAISNENLTQQIPNNENTTGSHNSLTHLITPEQFRYNNIPAEMPEYQKPISVGAPQPAPKSRPDTLDWSEEVELYAEIEEGLSDTVTRSSSMVSLNDTQSNVPSSNERKSRRKKNRKKSDGRNGHNRDRSSDTVTREQQQPRNSSRDRNDRNYRNQPGYQSRDNSRTRNKPGYHSRDNSRTRNPEYQPRGNNENYHNQKQGRKNSRDYSGDRSHRNSEQKDIDNKNWREEMRERCTNPVQQKETKKDADVPKASCQAPGILILPRDDASINAVVTDIPRQSTSYRHNQPPQNQQHSNAPSVPSQQKRLFDHHNPNKPIVVNTTSSRTSIPEQANPNSNDSLAGIEVNNHGVSYVTDKFGNVRPPWYDPERPSRKNEPLKIHIDVEIADLQLQWILKSGELIRDWNKVMSVRMFLQDSLVTLLKNDLKFCQIENVEHHYWKILYYNVIEALKKNMQNNTEEKDQSKELLYMLMDEGTDYFKNLLKMLEQTYRFKLDDFLGSNSYPPPKGLGYVGLALVSAQKMCIFLGDLARYKEQINDTPNYRLAREYYMNAQQLNPKNGRPYYQLAIIANYVRRRLDAVYYYMRSLMTSNPFSSARESLVQLFDDIRRRYEQSERKRREEKAERNKLHMKERERITPGGNSLRREIWIHPEGRRRVHRTTSTQSGVPYDTDEEDLTKLNSTEVYKRFVISYLHVLGKLITKIGMETFQEAALQMLKEFRALIQHSPLPLDSPRLLKLLALNMFAIESTQLKDAPLDSRYRSEVQECALVVSLQMFNLILEGCIALLKEQLENQNDQVLPRIVGEDLQVLLPAIKVWCDWMLCHKPIWNPPPSCSDYKVGSQADIWTRLAILMNLLEKLNYKHVQLASSLEEGYEMVRLPEDAMLCGFTPLMCNPQDPMYACKEIDIEVSQVCLRINRILFFGTEFLCGITPPVLKLQKFESGYSEYISVVRASQKEDNSSAPDLSSDSDLLLESFSEDEETDEKVPIQETINVNDATTPEEIRELLQRKEELERRQKTQERHRERVQAILQQSHVSVEIEVKPRLLVPDTNCFIDYLSSLKQITKAQINAQPIYTLDVPLVVFNELEGLARGGKTPAPVGRTSLDPAHIAKVAEAAKLALEFLRSRNPAVRCVTSRGAVVPLHSCTLEEDFDQDVGIRNDDRILATSLSLCRNTNKDQQNEDEPRRIYRDVVLLTDDRNLRVKALARDVPVRELPDFMKWAGLG